MAWRIEFDPGAVKDLTQQDRPIQKRLTGFLRERVANLANPRELGEALHGPELGQFWKYRVGDWRIVCELRDETITVLVLRIGHRRDVYRR